MNAVIPAAKLKTALATARKLAGRVSGDAAWTFHEGTLTVDWAGMCSTLEGSGSGRGTLRVRDSEMRRLSGTVPGRDEPLDVRVEGGRLHLGTFSIPAGPVAAETSAPAVPQLLPVNPSLLDVLVLAQRHPGAEIDAAGLHEAVMKASVERERRIREASALLGPLGISEEALTQWVERCVEAAARGEPMPSAQRVVVAGKGGQVKLFG